jgi:hypothetical protein
MLFRRCGSAAGGRIVHAGAHQRTQPRPARQPGQQSAQILLKLRPPEPLSPGSQPLTSGQGFLSHARLGFQGRRPPRPPPPSKNETARAVAQTWSRGLDGRPQHPGRRASLRDDHPGAGARDFRRPAPASGPTPAITSTARVNEPPRPGDASTGASCPNPRASRCAPSPACRG